MAQNITIQGASYSDVPSVELPKTGGGTARFDDTTIAAGGATASDILSGAKAFVNGNLVVGNMLMINPPTSTSNTHTGNLALTIQKATTTRYLQFNRGYLSQDVYYQINPVPNGTMGTPTATKSTVSSHTIFVTPSVTNGGGYIDGGTVSGTPVAVSASELVSGSETKTANGTYDVTNLAELVVNVSGGGGASNIVTGTFTTGSAAGASSISLAYTGSGYPIAAMVFIEGGAYNSENTDWYSKIQRYAVGMWSMSKAVTTSAPTYSTSGTQNQGVTCAIYKNSTSSATTYTRTSAMNTNVYTSSNATNAAATCVRLKSGNVLSYYVNTSSYGLLPNMTYRYIVVYSN